MKLRQGARPGQYGMVDTVFFHYSYLDPSIKNSKVQILNFCSESDVSATVLTKK